MNKKHPALLGMLSVVSCGLSVSLPPLLYALGQALGKAQVSSHLEQACGVAFLGLLLGGIIFGVAGWKQRLAKIGLGLSGVIVLSAFMFNMMASGPS